MQNLGKSNLMVIFVSLLTIFNIIWADYLLPEHIVSQKPNQENYILLVQIFDI